MQLCLTQYRHRKGQKDSDMRLMSKPCAQFLTSFQTRKKHRITGKKKLSAGNSFLKNVIKRY